MSDFIKDLATATPIQSYNVGDVVVGTVVVSNQKMILVDLEGQFTGIITGSHMSSSTEDTSAILPGSRIESIIIGYCSFKVSSTFLSEGKPSKTYRKTSLKF